MFGFSWTELLVTGAVALVVIGPKDIPKAMYEAGRLLRRLQYVRFAMSRQFEDFLKEHDLGDLRDVNFEAPPVQGEMEADEDEDYAAALQNHAPSFGGAAEDKAP